MCTLRTRTALDARTPSQVGRNSAIREPLAIFLHWTKAGNFWQRVLTAPGSLNIEPPPKIPSILPTLRPLFRPFFLGAERLLYVLYFLFSKWTVAMHDPPTKATCFCKPVFLFLFSCVEMH